MEPQLNDEWKVTRANDIEIYALREIRAALLEHGADPGILFPPKVLTRVRWESTEISPAFLERIIHGRADVNYIHSGGSAPLSLVLGFGLSNRKLEYADVLLRCGADIDARDNYGKTAVFKAIEWWELDSLDWLIARRADLTIPDNRGVKPIDIARIRVDILRKIEDALS